MSTTYTGDPTSGLSPSPVPGPDTIPIVTLPADGDAANAASVAQALKQPNNEIAWLKAPTATASAWLQAIRAYRNARGQRMSGQDHLGYPVGKFVKWQENWDDVAFPTINSTNVSVINPFLKRWNYSVSTVGTGSIYVKDPGSVVGGFTGPTNARFLVFATGGGSDMGLYLESTMQGLNDDDTSMTWQADYQFPSTTQYASSEISMGVGGVTLPAYTSAWKGAGAGVAFVKDSSDTHWLAVARPGPVFNTGTAATIVTTSVTANGNRHRFRIEYVGVNRSDDSISRALYYIDGTLVANIPIVFGAGVNGWRPFTRLQQLAAGSIALLFVGPTDFCLNLAAGDVLT